MDSLYVVLCLYLIISLPGVLGKDTVKTVCASTSQSHNGTNIQGAGKNDSLLNFIYQMNTTINELRKNLTQLQYSKRMVRHNVAPPNFGYDSKISFFRCPGDGTYVFSTSLSVYVSNGYQKYSIVKEGTVLASTYTYTSPGKGYRACSAMVTTPCKKGEDVWVANTHGSTRSVYSDSDGCSHFTGFKVY